MQRLLISYGEHLVVNTRRGARGIIFFFAKSEEENVTGFVRSDY